MYNKEEKVEACLTEEPRHYKFIDSVFNEIISYELGEQNDILRSLYNRVKENREVRLSEINEEAKHIELHLKELN